MRRERLPSVVSRLGVGVVLASMLTGCLIPEPRTGEYYRTTRLFWDARQHGAYPASVGLWFVSYAIGSYFVVGPCVGYPVGMGIYALEGTVFYPLWDTLCLPIDCVVRGRGTFDAYEDRLAPTPGAWMKAEEYLQER